MGNMQVYWTNSNLSFHFLFYIFIYYAGFQIFKFLTYVLNFYRYRFLNRRIRI